jgi:hypothetical protein
MDLSGRLRCLRATAIVRTRRVTDFAAKCQQTVSRSGRRCTPCTDQALARSELGSRAASAAQRHVASWPKAIPGGFGSVSGVIAPAQYCPVMADVVVADAVANARTRRSRSHPDTPDARGLQRRTRHRRRITLRSGVALGILQQVLGVGSRVCYGSDTYLCVCRRRALS